MNNIWIAIGISQVQGELELKLKEMISLESELVNRDIQINSISQELESVKNENVFCQNEIKNVSEARAVLAQQNDELNDANQKLKAEMSKIEDVRMNYNA